MEAELFDAIKANDFDKVKSLIENGANVNPKISKKFEFYTPLMLASEKGNFEIAKLLIDNGADVNKKSFCSTPLMLASEKGNFEIAKLLIENGAKINIKGGNGETVLIQAYRKDRINVDIVKLLISKGAHLNAVNDEGKTALFYACEKGEYLNDIDNEEHFEFIKILIDAGANIHLECNGFLPLEDIYDNKDLMMRLNEYLKN
jgi:ankyrin repeat protein